MSNDKTKAFKDLSESEQRALIAKRRKSAFDARESHKKSSYYSWGETIDDIKEAKGVAETFYAGTKWAGKSLFNIGKFTFGEVIPAFLETSSQTLEKSIKNKK